MKMNKLKKKSKQKSRLTYRRRNLIWYLKTKILNFLYLLRKEIKRNKSKIKDKQKENNKQKEILKRKKKSKSKKVEFKNQKRIN